MVSASSLAQALCSKLSRQWETGLEGLEGHDEELLAGK